MRKRRFAQVSTSDEEDEEETKPARSDKDGKGPKKPRGEGEEAGRAPAGKGRAEGGGEDAEGDVVQEDAKPVGNVVKVSGKGRKGKKHYAAFEYDGLQFELEDPVLLSPEVKNQKPYVAIIKSEETASEEEAPAAPVMREGDGGASSSAEEEAEEAGDSEEEDAEEEATTGRRPRQSRGSSGTRSRVTWDMVWGWYQVMPDSQRAMVDGMGFGPLLSVQPFRVDAVFIAAIRERWVEDCRAFVMPWGHMIPTLEDVAYLTGLPVQGAPVIGRELGDYRQEVTELLGEDLAQTKRAMRVIPLGKLPALVGLGRQRRGPLSDLDELLRSLRASAHFGQRSDEQEVRLFLIFFFGRLLFATTADKVSCKYLQFFRHLDRAGGYAWGAAMLGHLLAYLPSFSRQSFSMGGFTPFLQVWGYIRFPIGRGIVALRDAVPLMGRWQSAQDRRPISSRLGDIRKAIDDLDHEEVTWTPYADEVAEGHPSVVASRHLFDRELWLHCCSIAEPLFIRLVVRTLGWHQPMVLIPSLGFEGRSHRKARCIKRDWAQIHRDTLQTWQAGGTRVVPDHSLPDNAAYMADYTRRYADRLRLDRREVPDTEAFFTMRNKVLVLEGENRELRQQITALEAKLAHLRATGGGGAGVGSSSQAPGSSSVDLERRLEEALARAQAREEDLAQQREETSQAIARIQFFEAENASLSRQLGERPDESYWRGRLEAEDRRVHDISDRLERRTRELAEAQLKYQLLKDRVRRKAAQVGPRGSGPAQPSVGRPGMSSFISLDTIEVVGPLGDSGAMPQRSAAPEGSFTSRPPLSGQRRRLEQPDQPRQEEGEGSRQE